MIVILGLSLLLSSCCTFCSKCGVPEIRIEYRAPEFNCGAIQEAVFKPMDRSDVYRLSVTNIQILFSNLAEREKQIENIKNIVFCYEETVRKFNEIMVNKGDKDDKR